MYTFQALYQSYTEMCQDFGIEPSVQDFLDEACAMVNSRLQDGDDPRPQDVFIIEYALVNNL